jgi:hypothetical protein
MERPVKNWRRGMGLPKTWAKGGTNHTKHKTLAVLKAVKRIHGHAYYPVTDCETYDARLQRSADLYGFLDILVGHDRGIQACGTDWQAHIDKLRFDVNQNKLKWWLADDRRRLELWGWRRLKIPGTEQQEWWPRIQLITSGFLWNGEKPVMIPFKNILNNILI